MVNYTIKCNRVNKKKEFIQIRGKIKLQNKIYYKGEWSPEQISNTPCGMKMPSFKTIYRWIDERYLRSTLKNLRRKGKTKKRLGNSGRFTTGKSIRRRDKSVYSRKEFGHWEADTVVSGQGKSKACFATLAERKTRYYIAVKIPDRKGETMAKAIIDALSKFPEGAVKTITCDRGSEFACWREIEKALKCDAKERISGE